MDFLTNAIFSVENGSLLGAVLTHYSPENYLERATVKFYTRDELYSEMPSLQPRGFALEADGVLTADSNVRWVLSKDVAAFVGTEYNVARVREVDITDLVLYGVQYGGASIMNKDEVLYGKEEPIIIPFQNYKVSSSSFNIYGAYKIQDGTYRTHSLLELEDGGGKEFYCIFPEDVDLSWAASICEACDDITVRDTVMTLYKVNSCIKPFYTCVGEPFLNFLAYSVAYYNIGREFLKEISPIVRDTVAPKYEQPKRERRFPRKNVTFEHSYGRLCLSEILEYQANDERLTEYLQSCPEATITMHWLSKLVSSPWYQNTDGDESDKIKAASGNLAIECKEYGLKYGLELLTHRYYLSTIRRFEDYIPLVLRGGGVDGESIKRVTGKQG